MIINYKIEKQQYNILWVIIINTVPKQGKEDISKHQDVHLYTI